MKKLLILFTALYFFNLQNTTAQRKYSEDFTWDVIRERLFGGNNYKAFRFEDDIRIQLKGSPNNEDSSIFRNIVEELDTLTETVNVKLVEDNGNFIISILPPNDGLGLRTDQKRDFDNYIIKKAEIDFNLRYRNSYEEKRRDYYYYTIRSLTVLYQNKITFGSYGGIFYYNNIPEYVNFTEVDKDLIRKLYSHHFYKKLKENTINQKGYLNYLFLRHKNFITYISAIIGAFLIVVLLYFLFSYSVLRKSKNLYLKYLFTGIFLSIAISLILMFLFLPEIIEVLPRFENRLVLFIVAIVLVIIFGFFVVNLIYIIEHYLISPEHILLRKLLIVFLSTFGSIIFIWIAFHLIVYFLQNDPRNFSFYRIIDLSYFIILIMITISILRVFFLFLNYRMQGIVNQKDVALARMKELKNQAELNALHSRINPHFLYNSLNSIAGLAHSDPDKTEKMATSLSSLFRYSINKEEKTYATVNEELEMVQKYLDVEKVRFGEKLNYVIETDDEVTEKQIPKFIIQPLVENAIKHGLSKITETGKLKIEIKQEHKDLVIRIFDNGPDFPDEPVKGYGLQNLHDKLQILYGDEAALNWQNGENKNIQVTLKNQF